MVITDSRRGETATIEPHQLTALWHLDDNPRACLFMEMGLGKTLVTLTHIRYNPYNRVLIIAPKSVAIHTWSAELDKWDHLRGLTYAIIAKPKNNHKLVMPEDKDIHILSVSNLEWFLQHYVYKKSGKWRGSIPYDCVVLDELTLFKSGSSRRFKYLRKALDLSNTPFRIGLTGTPKPNGDLDLWSQMCLIDSGERLGKTQTEYTDKYFKQTVRGGRHTYNILPGASEKIAREISDICLSMKTTDHIELPDLHIIDEVLDFSADEMALYKELEREYTIAFDDDEDLEVRTAADLSNKLLQLSSGAVYRPDGSYRTVNTLKLDILGEILEENPSDNFIIVYQFKHEAERIMERYPFVEMYDPVTTMERWNAGEIRAFVGHPASMGHGLNMQHGGRCMIMFSTTWNLEHYLQVIFRILRRGNSEVSKQDMKLWRLLVRGTRDIKVRSRLESKRSDQDFLMQELNELRAEHNGKNIR